MAKIITILVFLLASFVSNWIVCLRFIPERVLLEYVDPKVAVNASLIIKRYGRNSDYYINLQGVTVVEFNNNITLTAVFYEFLNNQYKRSFVEFRYRFCDLVNKDPLIGRMLAITGRVPCPAPPGLYVLHNMTVPSEQMTYVWPFEKCRVNIELVHTHSNASIARGEMFLSLVKNKKKG